MKKLPALLTILMGFCLLAAAAENPAGDWMGTIPISDAKLEGDKISFSVADQMGTVRAYGTLSGDTMKVTDYGRQRAVPV